jgi:hypothetical protein
VDLFGCDDDTIRNQLEVVYNLPNATRHTIVVVKGWTVENPLDSNSASCLLLRQTAMGDCRQVWCGIDLVAFAQERGYSGFEGDEYGSLQFSDRSSGLL